MRSSLLLGFLLSLVQVSSSSAVAQTQSDERARELYLLGDDLYSQGRYEEALAAFEESYQLSGRPLLLFNIANAQERSGLWQAAIESLEAYLPHADEAEAGRVRARIQSLRQRVERLESMRRVEGGGDDEEPNETAPPTPRRDIAPPLVLATGGAVLVGGVVAAIIAQGARSTLRDECALVGDRRLCPNTVGDAEARDRRASISADVLFVAAAATLAVGLYLLLRPRAAPPPLEPGAAFAPGAGAVTLRGRF
ncbi:MAG: tetratricopeptide repeat protein [Myxococcales bacterium]|nr:tetratricopeptide repeat protein [Myxococcales bacterium]